MEGKNREKQSLGSIVRKNLFVHLFIPLISLSLIANLLYFTISYGQLKKQHSILTLVGVGFFQHYVNDICRLLLTVSRHITNDDVESYIYIQKFLESHQTLQNVFIYDTVTNQVSRIYPVYSPDLYGLPGAGHFPGQLKNTDLDGICYVSSPYYSPYSNSVTVAFAFRSGKTVAIGEAKAEQMLKINLMSQVFRDTLLFVTDKSGNVIIHPNTRLMAEGENLSQEKWFHEVTKRPSKEHIAFHQGRFYIIVGTADAFSGWWCFAATPLSSFLFPYVRMQLIILVACMIFCAAIFYSTRRWLMKTVVRPVEDLTRDVRLMAGIEEAPEDLSVEVKGTYGSFKELDECFRVIASTVERLSLKEQALAESEEKFRTIAENAPVALGIFQDDVLIYSNEEAQRLTGYTAEELKKIKLSELVHREYREQVRERILIRQTTKAPPVHYEALPVVVKGGDLKWFRVSAGSVEVSGRPAGLLVAVDVTPQILALREKAEYEKKFRHMQRLEAIGVLASGIAHEFNNLLHGISMNVEVLKSRLKDRHELESYLENLSHLIKRGANLVRGLLTYSRRRATEQEIISAHEEIARVMTISRASFPKHIVLEEQLEAERDQIIAETGHVEQIVMNLLNNAKDAIGDRPGRIIVRTSLIFLDRPQVFGLSAPGFYLRLEVEDNGSGMTPHIKERIFDPFFTTKEVGKGTGLGLSVILGIVESLGGRIFCESELGKGTTFTVLLPSAEKGAGDLGRGHGGKEACEQVLDSLSLSMLLIDDEEVLGSLMKEFFEERGHTVHYYSRAEAALEFLEKVENKPDLVIVDLGLPGMSGREFLEVIKTKYPNIPVIVASGYLSQDLLKNYRAYGASAYLSKPFSTEELIEAIREVIPVFKG